MLKLERLPTPEDTPTLEASPLVPPLDAATLTRHPPDAHWLLTDGNLLRGRCSLWWRQTPPLPGMQVGVIGHYAVADDDAAHRLLDHACAELAAQGCMVAIGPMDGNTMHRYRFVVDRGEEPPFFLEPQNPEEWPRHWCDAGFTELASYTSALNTDLSYEDPRIPAVAARLTATGVTIRTINLGDFAGELRRIYQIAGISFRSNYLYTPFTEEEFLALYRPIRPYVRPETTLLAEHAGQPVGFIFSVPDMLQAQRGVPVDTLIVKTFAVLPGRAYAGLGSVLLARSHAVARALGFHRVIHALMYDANNSRLISGRFARTMRRYALFTRTLRP